MPNKNKTSSSKKGKRSNPWFDFIRKIQSEKKIKKWGDAIKEAVVQKSRYYKEQGTMPQKDKKGGMDEKMAEKITAKKNFRLNARSFRLKQGGDVDLEEANTLVQKEETNPIFDSNDNEVKSGGKRKSKKRKASKSKSKSKTRKQRKTRRSR